MTKSQKNEPDGVEKVDDWARFERAVDAAVKSGPKHKTAAQPKQRASKGRVHKGKAEA